MRITLVSLAATCVALTLGVAALICFGTQPPPWLLRAEMAAVSLTAVLFGFSGRMPSFLPWLRLRSVRGAAAVYLGVAAVYLPPQLMISGMLIGIGIRLVWAEACLLPALGQEPAAGTAIARATSTGTLAAREAANGQVVEARPH